jgi:hypothetical protein
MDKRFPFNKNTGESETMIPIWSMDSPNLDSQTVDNFLSAQNGNQPRHFQEARSQKEQLQLPSPPNFAVLTALD